jgi:Protein of unknown function (DUF1573)
MNRANTVLLILFFSSGLSIGQNLTDKKTPILTWETTTHDFGDIIQGDKVQHTFRFVNSGTEPLIITNVEVTCGCTVPKGWPRDPIMAGGKGEIEIMFNSTGKKGKQNKVVTVISNSAPGNSQITFTATVLEKKPN